MEYSLAIQMPICLINRAFENLNQLSLCHVYTLICNIQIVTRFQQFDQFSLELQRSKIYVRIRDCKSFVKFRFLFLFFLFFLFFLLPHSF